MNGLLKEVIKFGANGLNNLRKNFSRISGMILMISLLREIVKTCLGLTIWTMILKV